LTLIKPGWARLSYRDRMSSALQLVNIYISPGHNFFGHHGKPADDHPVIELTQARCVAGRGIEGDRFFDHKKNYKGQITFFAREVYQALCEKFQLWTKPPSVFRRNVITSGFRLEDLIGAEFEIQGVRFEGMESCAPCYWMDQAFCKGAEQAMQGQGGLRARILTSGILRTS
jgi:MOSC domain-containing protein YiiM